MCTILSIESNSVCSSKKMEILDELSNVYLNLKPDVLKIGAIIKLSFMFRHSKKMQMDVTKVNNTKQSLQEVRLLLLFGVFYF